jgi:uncharacterized protein with HEPN domain
MKSKIGDRARLQHILESIQEINNYISNISYEVFASNSMILFASIKQLEIIGEAANHITEHFRRLYKEIQWQEIIGLRNLLIHEYFGIDIKIIWDIIKNDIPKLKSKVEEILNQII